MKSLFRLLLGFFGGLHMFRDIIFKFRLFGLGFRLLNAIVLYGSILSLQLGRDNVNGMIALLNLVVHLPNIESRFGACFEKCVSKTNQMAKTTNITRIKITNGRFGLLFIRCLYTSIKRGNDNQIIRSYYFGHWLLSTHIISYTNKINISLARRIKSAYCSTYQL